MDTIHYKPGVARDWRRSRKLTQEQLAQVARVSRPTIARIEIGNPNVTLDSLSAVADFFGRPLSELLIGEKPQDSQAT